MKPRQERISYYDNLKFILILLVVVGHVIGCQLDINYMNGIYLFIYTFHMPLFIFITGFLAKKLEDKNGNFRLYKVINYILLYLIFKISLFSFSKFILHQDIELYIFTEGEAPWYILACAIWLSFTYLVKNVKPKYMLIFSIVFALIIGYDYFVSDVFALSRTIVFYPFFLLGFYISKEKLNKFVEIIHQRKYQIISIICLSTLFVIMIMFASNIDFIKNFFFSKTPYYFIIPFEGYLFYPLFRLLFFVIAIIVGIMVMALIPRRKLFFTKLGSRTLQIYVLHMFFIYFIFYTRIDTYLSSLFGDFWPLITIIGGIILTFALSFGFIEKPFKKIINLKYRKIFEQEKN